MVGNTEVGIEMKFMRRDYKVLIASTHVPELNTIAPETEGLRVGSAVTLTRLLHTLKKQIQSLPAEQVAVFKAVVSQLRWFAGLQIRNTASLGGNIVTGGEVGSDSVRSVGACQQPPAALCRNICRSMFAMFAIHTTCIPSLLAMYIAMCSAWPAFSPRRMAMYVG